MLIARRGGPTARDAFGELVNRHGPWLIAYLSYLLVDPSLGEDVAQEVFVTAHRTLGTLRDPTAFRPWLRSIGTRKAFNQRRNRGTRTRYETDLGVPRPYSAPDPDAQDDRDAVLAALEKLPYAYREVLVLKYIEELSIDEIAHQLDLGTSATKMRLARARDAFRPLYAGVTHGK